MFWAKNSIATARHRETEWVMKLFVKYRAMTALNCTMVCEEWKCAQWWHILCSSSTRLGQVVGHLGYGSAQLLESAGVLWSQWTLIMPHNSSVIVRLTSPLPCWLGWCVCDLIFSLQMSVCDRLACLSDLSAEHPATRDIWLGMVHDGWLVQGFLKLGLGTIKTKYAYCFTIFF